MVQSLTKSQNIDKQIENYKQNKVLGETREKKIKPRRNSRSL